MKSNKKITYIIFLIATICLLFYFKIRNSAQIRMQSGQSAVQDQGLAKKNNISNGSNSESKNLLPKSHSLITSFDRSLYILRSLKITGYFTTYFSDNNGHSFTADELNHVQPIDFSIVGVSLAGLGVDSVGPAPSDEVVVNRIKEADIDFDMDANLKSYSLVLSAIRDTDIKIQNQYYSRELIRGSDIEITTLSLKKGETKTITIDASTVPLKLTIN